MKDYLIGLLLGVMLGLAYPDPNLIGPLCIVAIGITVGLVVTWKG